MKKILSTIVTILMFVTFFLGGMTTFVKAAGVQVPVTCTVRVEGLNGTITKGSASGDNALEILKSVLDTNKITYQTKVTSFGSTYVSSINNLMEKHFNGMDGWMFYDKSSTKIVTPDLGMDSYKPQNGDELVVYYTNTTGETPFVNSVIFNPQMMKPNQAFTMNFNWKHDLYDSNWKPIPTSSPIAKANVTIDNQNYITDDYGLITIPKGLSLGTHTYKISKYNTNPVTPASVVTDIGTFTIDGKVAPELNYLDSNYESQFDIVDNSKITKDINGDISTTSVNLSKLSDPWIAIEMKKLGLNINKSFVADLALDIKSNGVTSLSNTDLERSIMGLTSAGYSPYNFMGQNLVSRLYNQTSISKFGINDLIFGLCAYNYANIKDDYTIKKKDFVSQILTKKLPSTGWAISGDKLNGDMTGMALNALAPYYSTNLDVKSAVDSAVQSISDIETDSGYIPTTDGITSETLSMVIVGLTSIGVDPQGTEFTKSKGDLVAGLLSFKGTNGMFKHTLKGTNDPAATEQALRALIALKNFESGPYNYYKSNIDASKLPIYKQSNLDDKLDPIVVNKNQSKTTLVNKARYESALVPLTSKKAATKGQVSMEALPQTGFMIDTTALIVIGVLLIMSGLGLILIRKKKYNQ